MRLEALVGFGKLNGARERCIVTTTTTTAAAASRLYITTRVLPAKTAQFDGASRHPLPDSYGIALHDTLHN